MTQNQLEKLIGETIEIQSSPGTIIEVEVKSSSRFNGRIMANLEWDGRIFQISADRIKFTVT